MKKTYEAPKAEKLDFNYRDTVTASGGNLKPGANINGCHTGSNANKGCTPVYG